MKHLTDTIRAALAYWREAEPYLSVTTTAKALTALAELEAMAGEHEPVAWIEHHHGSVAYNPYPSAARKLPDGVRFDLYTAAPPAQHAAIQRKDALLRQALDAVENVNTTMPFLVAHELRQAITKELAK